MTRVVRTGGVQLDGVSIGGPPSAAGQWAGQWDNSVVDFDRDAFARLLMDKGYLVLWEKAMLCPNVPGTGLSPRDHVINCQVCGGLGFIYVDPIDTVGGNQLAMLFQGIRLNESFYAYGRWDGGQGMITAPPEVQLDYWDRITLKNGSARFTERVARQPGTSVDVLRYAALGLLHVSWVNRSGSLTTFVVDTDVTLSADGTSLQWLTATPPDDLSFYTVGYTYRPRYIIQDMVHHHRESSISGVRYPFPIQAVAKLDYLIRNVAADPQQVVEQSPF